MHFRVEAAAGVGSSLVYRPSDYAFDVEPKPEGGEASLLVNDLQLEIDDEGRVLYVWGFCPHTSWSPASVKPPPARRATLTAEIPDDLAPGTSMRISKERWPVHVDQQTGWVRVGTCDEGDVVEFVPGVRACLSEGNLVCLWLRPRELPHTLSA